MRCGSRLPSVPKTPQVSKRVSCRRKKPGLREVSRLLCRFDARLARVEEISGRIFVSGSPVATARRPSLTSYAARCHARGNLHPVCYQILTRRRILCLASGTTPPASKREREPVHPFHCRYPVAGDGCGTVRSPVPAAGRYGSRDASSFIRGNCMQRRGRSRDQTGREKTSLRRVRLRPSRRAADVGRRRYLAMASLPRACRCSRLLTTSSTHQTLHGQHPLSNKRSGTRYHASGRRPDRHCHPVMRRKRPAAGGYTHSGSAPVRFSTG